mgnify:CR=1 FL=1
MKIFSLSEYVRENGQAKAAAILGMTQGAVSQAVAKNRDIYIEEKDGITSAYEIKRFMPTEPTQAEGN